MDGVPFCIGGVCVVIVPAVKRGDKQVRQIDGEPERILVIIIRDADDLRAGLPGLERVEDLLIGLSVAEGVCVTVGPDVDARVDLHAGILPRLFPRNSDRGEAERGVRGIVRPEKRTVLSQNRFCRSAACSCTCSPAAAAGSPAKTCSSNVTSSRGAATACVQTAAPHAHTSASARNTIRVLRIVVLPAGQLGKRL